MNFLTLAGLIAIAGGIGAVVHSLVTFHRVKRFLYRPTPRQIVNLANHPSWPVCYAPVTHGRGKTAMCVMPKGHAGQHAVTLTAVEETGYTRPPF